MIHKKPSSYIRSPLTLKYKFLFISALKDWSKSEFIRLIFSFVLVNIYDGVTIACITAQELIRLLHLYPAWLVGQKAYGPNNLFRHFEAIHLSSLLLPTGYCFLI